VKSFIEMVKCCHVPGRSVNRTSTTWQRNARHLDDEAAAGAPALRLFFAAGMNVIRVEVGVGAHQGYAFSALCQWNAVQKHAIKRLFEFWVDNCAKRTRKCGQTADYCADGVATLSVPRALQQAPQLDRENS